MQTQTLFGVELTRLCAVALLFSFTAASFAETNILEATPAQLKKLSLEDLMKLDVTSVSRRPEPYSQAPAAIQVITQEEIRRSGASSIPEALRLANNLQVAQVDAHNWAISARGFNGGAANKLLVLIDGRTVYTPLFSGVFWDVQDYLLEDLDRIEVISGPGATLWGANAVNGVINIISKSAKDTQGGLLTGGGGTELQGFAGIRYGGMLASNVYYRIYGKYFDRDSSVYSQSSTNGRSTKNGEDDWRMGQGGFRVDWEESQHDLFTFQGDLYNGEENQLMNDDISLHGGNLLSRWSHTISDESDLSLQLYYDATHREIPGTLTDDLDTYDADFQHHFQIGERNGITWGLGYRFTRNVVHNSPTVGFLPSRLDRNIFSGFVQDEIKLTEKLFFTLGTKLEHNDYTGIEVQPSGRLTFQISSNQMLWSAVSRAVRTPSRIDRNLFSPTTPPFAIAGGPDFDSEKLIAYELGYRVQATEKLSASVSTFYNQYDDIRSVRPGPPLVIANDLEGDTYGIELDASYQALEWWRLRAGYNYIHEDIHVKHGRSDLSQGLAETSDPEQQISLQSLMSLPCHLELDGRLRWVDRLSFFSAGKVGNVSSYFGLDIRLGWNPRPDLEFSIVGQNLVDNRHAEFGFPDSTQHEIERGVFGRVTWRF